MRPLLALMTLLGQPQVPAEIDQAVQRHLQTTQTPGCSIAIVRDGKVVYAKGYGLSNVEADAPATDETIYRIGSLTKPFTAALVMRHVESGAIALDDPITKHLTDLPKAYAGVTVRQLLSHTSGVPNYTSLPDFGRRMREAVTAKAMIDMAAAAPADFKPGEKWNYSNTGYILLGELVAKLDKRPWETSLAEVIAKPLGLTTTQPSDAIRIVKRRAAGYSRTTNGLANAPMMDLSWPGSAGVLESNVQDLAKFMEALGSTILNPETFAQMVAATKTNDGKPTSYGLGWGVAPINNVPMWSHGGSIPGFQAWMGKVPSKKLSVVVLTNSDSTPVGTLGRRLLGLADPELATKEAAIKDENPELTAFLKGKLERLLKGELTQDELTPEFAKVMTPQLVQDVAKSLGSAGSLTKFELIDSQTAGDNTQRSYLIEIGPLTLTASFGVTKDRKIAGLSIRA